jgi:hypothetical protein
MCPRWTPSAGSILSLERASERSAQRWRCRPRHDKRATGMPMARNVMLGKEAGPKARLAVSLPRPLFLPDGVRRG